MELDGLLAELTAPAALVGLAVLKGSSIESAGAPVVGGRLEGRLVGRATEGRLAGRAARRLVRLWSCAVGMFVGRDRGNGAFVDAGGGGGAGKDDGG